MCNSVNCTCSITISKGEKGDPGIPGPPGNTGDNLYTGPSPSTVTVNNIPAGTNLLTYTVNQLIGNIYAPSVSPVFTSFYISGQPNIVEVGTTLSGSKTFLWSINVGSGIVNTIDIYDNTAGSTLLAGTTNDGSQVITITTNPLLADGSSQSFKGIGNNTSPVATFNSANFVVTARYLEFYSDTASAATNSAQVRSLVHNRFTSSGNVFTMQTGTTNKIFQIAIPATKTITQVFDNTAGFDITVTFILSNIMVDDAAGTPTNYNVYTLTNAVTYAVNHQFTITTT